MNKEISQKILNILLNIIGSCMLAFGVCAFIAPTGMIVGGATGISLIVNRLTGINISTVALVLNLAVLPIGYIFGGKKLVLGSILSSIVYPVALAFFERIDVITTIADTTLLAGICGGVVCGAGIGLVMHSGGSTGGMDIPVLAVHKLTRIPVGKLMNATDTVIMISQIPLSGLTSIIYGLFYTFIMTNALNTTLTYGSDRMKLTVVTEQFEEIRQALISNDYGVTMIDAESGFTRTPIQEIESIMRSAQVRRATQIIESIDPTAFITIEKVKDVKGRGFTIEREFIDLSE